MRSLRSLEGYVMIDHRDSPGVPEAMEVAVGLTPGSTRRFFETAVVTCNHCQKQIMLRPDRSRERGYCRGCDHYICDNCTTEMARTLECVPFSKVLDRAREAAYLAEQREKIPTGFGLLLPVSEQPTPTAVADFALAIDKPEVSRETPAVRSLIIPA